MGSLARRLDRAPDKPAPAPAPGCRASAANKGVQTDFPVSLLGENNNFRI